MIRRGYGQFHASGSIRVSSVHSPSGPLPPPATLVGDEMRLVEERLTTLLASREPRLNEIAGYLIGAGGKRVRPAVTLLVFRACGGRNVADAVDVAVALELIHSASLLHDDIIDENRIRRGRDSPRAKFGVAETLVTGDFLFSRAFQLCGRFDAQLVDWAAEACVALTEGEIMQGRFRRNPAVRLDDYQEIIARKTASLFEVGARTAAYLAGAEASTVEALARCGNHVGVTFQMIDDLLDVTAAEAELGKPVGLDVREGNPSLPLVLAIEHDDEIRRLFGRPELSEGEVSAVLGRLRRSGVIARGYALAAEHAGSAREALLVLPDSPYRRYLLAMVDQLLDRAA
jgi:octaprenyl-diphosphate synthase